LNFGDGLFFGENFQKEKNIKMNAWQLFIEGIAVFPLSNPYFTLYLEEQFLKALKECKEIREGKEEEFVKMGSPDRYGLLYFSSIYHHPYFRMLRSLCYSNIIDGLRQQGAYAYKSIMCKFQPVGTPFYVEKPEYVQQEVRGDGIALEFNGWLNLSTQHQSIFYLREGVEIQVKVPPGHIVLYRGNLLRRNDKRGSHRFYLSFTISQQDMFTEGKVIHMIEEQSSLYENTLYRKSGHFKNWKNVLIPHPLLSSGKETPSLKSLGKMFPPYEKQEVNILRPVILF